MKTRLLNQIMRSSQALEEQQPQPQEIELQGPLSVIYAKALDLAYSTVSPVTGKADANNTTVPAVESQAMDEMIAVQAQAQAVNKLHDIIHGGEADSIRVYTTGTGVSAQTETEPSPVEVFKDALSYLEKDSVNVADFIFVESAMNPSVDAPLGGNNPTLLHAPVEPKVGLENMDTPCENPQDETVTVAVESITVIIKTRQIKVSPH